MEAIIFSTRRTECLEPEPRILGDPVMAFALEAAARAGAARTQTFGSSFTQVFAHPAPGAPELILPENGLVLVFAAPMPLIKPETIQKCVAIHHEEGNACTAVSDVYVFQASKLLETYRQMQRPPVFEGTIEQEIMRRLAADGQRVRRLEEEDGEQFLVVEDHARLALAARVMKERINAAHMANGVAIADPSNTYIGKDVTIGAGTLIHPGTFLEGQTVIGERCVLGPNTRLANVTLADNVKVEFSVALDSTVGSGTAIGPFAYLRPNSAIGRNCKVGDFVEVKNSVIADGSKASHLTYIGDSDVGARVNFGCGTVTVNYDGANKARTVIEDDVFIGCNTNLIAPVTVGEGAYIAAGSTITGDVEANGFAIARARQVNKTGWKRKGRL